MRSAPKPPSPLSPSAESSGTEAERGSVKNNRNRRSRGSVHDLHQAGLGRFGVPCIDDRGMAGLLDLECLLSPRDSGVVPSLIGSTATVEKRADLTRGFGLEGFASAVL